MKARHPLRCGLNRTGDSARAESFAYEGPHPLRCGL